MFTLLKPLFLSVTVKRLPQGHCDSLPLTPIYPEAEFRGSETDVFCGCFSAGRQAKRRRRKLTVPVTTKVLAHDANGASFRIDAPLLAAAQPLDVSVDQALSRLEFAVQAVVWGCHASIVCVAILPAAGPTHRRFRPL